LVMVTSCWLQDTGDWCGDDGVDMCCEIV